MTFVKKKCHVIINYLWSSKAIWPLWSVHEHLSHPSTWRWKFSNTSLACQDWECNLDVRRNLLSNTIRKDCITSLTAAGAPVDSATTTESMQQSRLINTHTHDYRQPLVELARSLYIQDHKKALRNTHTWWLHWCRQIVLDLITATWMILHHIYHPTTSSVPL